MEPARTNVHAENAPYLILSEFDFVLFSRSVLALWIHESFRVDALALIAEFFDTILAVELWF